MPADHRRTGHHAALGPRAVMWSIARISNGQRAVHDLAQLFDDGDAHGNHGTARTKRWNHRIPFFHRQARADGNGFLTAAGEHLYRHLAFVLPTDAGLFEQTSHKHVSIEMPLDVVITINT